MRRFCKTGLLACFALSLFGEPVDTIYTARYVVTMDPPAA